jgi:hypothetical protein
VLGAFNAPDTADMILRDSNTGHFGVDDITNNAIIAAASMGQVGTEWQVSGIAADPPGASTAQLAQTLASFGSPHQQTARRFPLSEPINRSRRS